MSLPTNGGTDRDAVSSLPALSFSLLSRPPSYSISRSQIVSSAHGLVRKRSHSDDSSGMPPVSSSRIAFAPPHVSFSSSPSSETQAPTAGWTTGGSAAAAALRCQLPVLSAAKRLRRDPLSPTSVGEVSDAKRMPPAKTASTPGAAQMQSMLRGLQHLSTCRSCGCTNPLCVSTRTFVDKVKAHRSAMAGKVTHDANRCGACKLWRVIVQAHAPTCSAGATCRVPGCTPQQ